MTPSQKAARWIWERSSPMLKPLTEEEMAEAIESCLDENREKNKVSELQAQLAEKEDERRYWTDQYAQRTAQLAEAKEKLAAYENQKPATSAD